MSNILITSVGRRVSLVKAFQEEFSKLNTKGKVYVCDCRPDLSSASQVADKAFKTCRIEEEGYIALLLKICIDNNIKPIIPTIDTELLILSKNVELFLENGISIVLSEKDFIETTNSKVKTQEFFTAFGIDVAKLYSKNDYKLPLFIKPISGSGSTENYTIFDESQFSKYHFDNEYLRFFEYIDHKDYDEYTCDLYYDKNSILKCVIPRKRIEVRAGEVSKGITSKNVVKTFLKEKFSKIEGARGCITIQVFFNDKTKKVIGVEINPRFGGGFPLSYLAGGNYPKWILEEYLYSKDIEYFDKWEDNLLMLRYDAEILVHND